MMDDLDWQVRTQVKINLVWGFPPKDIVAGSVLPMQVSKYRLERSDND
jgi:hypothetical protein